MCWLRAARASARSVPCAGARSNGCGPGSSKMSAMSLGHEELLMKLGAARAKARAAWRLLNIEVAADAASFSYALNRKKLRQVRRREGRYLLRTNLCGRDPAQLWQFYIQLVEVEAAFKNLKDDLQLRPIYHQLEERIEAHIFVAFLAYCLQITLRARLKPMAPGLTPRAVLDKSLPCKSLEASKRDTRHRTALWHPCWGKACSNTTPNLC